MGYAKYMKQTWKSDEFKELMKSRLISWRKQPTVLKIERPTRLDRAHSLGYKAKQGYVMARIRIKKGTRKREKPKGGRKPLRQGQTSMPPGQSLRRISEMRVARRFPNLEVLNSYYMAEDGKQIWFEVILVDPSHNAIKNDPKINWICKPQHRGRVFRGLTSAGKKHRMIRGRGKGFERKNRPGKR